MESFLERIAPTDNALGLVILFMILSVINWWMDSVQSTTMNIYRANDHLPKDFLLMLNPYFLRASFPVTLAKWAVAGLYAVNVSWKITILALFVVWLIGVFSPIPWSLTLPCVRRKINSVKKMDSHVGEVLERMVARWEDVGRRF